MIEYRIHLLDVFYCWNCLHTLKNYECFIISMYIGNTLLYGWPARLLARQKVSTTFYCDVMWQYMFFFSLSLSRSCGRQNICFAFYFGVEKRFLRRLYLRKTFFTTRNKQQNGSPFHLVLVLLFTVPYQTSVSRWLCRELLQSGGLPRWHDLLVELTSIIGDRADWVNRKSAAIRGIVVLCYVAPRFL